MKHLSPVRKSRIAIAVFFYGSVVGFTSADRSNDKSWVDLMAGIGLFTRHITVTDCSGKILEERRDNYPIADAGVSIRHDFGYGTVFGRAGGFHTQQKVQYVSSGYKESPSDDLSYSSLYVGGGIGLNTPYFGLDFGMLYFQNAHESYFPISHSNIQPMGKMRFGFEDSWYISTSLLYNTALMSQGGIFDLGLGLRFSGTRSTLWMGMGGAPYSNAQWIVRCSIQPEYWKAAISLSGNFGLTSDGDEEYGLALGVRVDLK
ncbi:MAG: hypothetical protein Q8916_08360 [Bacteroidota bacterium]|nr:hypothetical protein [Bacteroidota bacterium]MDP4230398.1 hypothetical protein [Bacteroidota bacterium]MDP4237224.1 hypothetical protein [Bacteroidota bacterium]